MYQSIKYLQYHTGNFGSSIHKDTMNVSMDRSPLQRVSPLPFKIEKEILVLIPLVLYMTIQYSPKKEKTPNMGWLERSLESTVQLYT